jgi:hypothetical protein
MQVNVANPTLLTREFHYRMPQDGPGRQRFSSNVRVLKIPAGGQVKMSEDLDGTDLKSIIEQLQAAGAVPQSEVQSITLPKSLIFDVSKTPIKVDNIEEGLERDEEARQEVAAQKMEEAGLGAFKTTQDTMNSTGARGKLTETSVEIVEVTDRGPVKDGVNVEFVNSTKRGGNKKRTEEKS